MEGLSYALVPVLYLYGYASLAEVALFLALAIVLGSLLSVMGVLLQESTRLRPARPRDLARLLLAGFLDNLGYHQMHLLWRIGGTFDYFVRRRTDLGLMQRYGSFQAPPAR